MDPSLPVGAAAMRRRIGFGCHTMLCVVALLVPGLSNAQTTGNERAFPQSKAVIEKALKQLQDFTSGRLPTLDGFAMPDERPLDRFQRGYFQCTVQVSSRSSGGSLVRVSAKITAWYAAPGQSQSGYQVLPSNGRLESDLLDRLQEALGSNGVPPVSASAPTKSEAAKARAPASTATKSAPMPTGSMPDAPSTSASAQAFHMGTATGSAVPSLATQKAVEDRHVEALQTDAKNLEEILRNQSHPSNLVAVNKAGTPVLATPNKGGKVLFLAAAEDEFELLDLNSNWVHVRISGLSRGWIERSRVEMNGVSVPEVAQMPPPAVPAPASTPTKTTNAARFQVEHEEIASFPGTWEPLRGKTVKIISVLPTMPTGGDSQAKLDFAKSVFDKEYNELTADQTTATGVVVIFDSADGGMLATTLPVLRQWKEGTLSEEAMWRRCFVDPPEMVSITANR